MKKLFFCFLFAACISPQEPRKDRNALKQKKQVELAMLEMYKLNSCCDCDCTAMIYKNNGDVDTMNVLSANVKIDTIEYLSDTTFYYFSFFDQDSSEYTQVYTVKKPFPECLHYYAIGYIGEENTPFKALIFENGYYIYEDDVGRSQRDSVFKQCILKNKSNLCEFLAGRMDQNNQ